MERGATRLYVSAELTGIGRSGLKIVLFQLVTPFSIKFPRLSLCVEAGRFLSDDFCNTGKTAEKRRDSHLQIDEKVVVLVGVLAPANANCLGMFLAK